MYNATVAGLLHDRVRRMHNNGSCRSPCFSSSLAVEKYLPATSSRLMDSYAFRYVPALRHTCCPKEITLRIVRTWAGKLLARLTCWLHQCLAGFSSVRSFRPASVRTYAFLSVINLSRRSRIDPVSGTTKYHPGICSADSVRLRAASFQRTYRTTSGKKQGGRGFVEFPDTVPTLCSR